MKRMVYTALLVVSVLLLVFAIADAQEATQQPEPPAAPVEFEYADDDEVVLDILQILGIAVSSFLIGGLTIGALSIKLLQNKPALDALERIATNTVPAHLLIGARTVIKNGRRFIILADMVTDGQPNVPLTDEDVEKLALS